MPRSPKGRIRRIAVLGSGKVREKDPGYRQALKLGQAIARKGFSVCHGGYGGVMEAVAKGCRLARLGGQAGGHNTGITIRSAPLRPGLCRGNDRVLTRVNPWVDTEIKMPCWQSRLFKLIEMGDAYIFLDGAAGTLAELFVVIEMTNRGLLKKPAIILGKKLGSFVRSLKKDPHFDIPRRLVFATSVAQAVRYLKI